MNPIKFDLKIAQKEMMQKTLAAYSTRKICHGGCVEKTQTTLKLESAQ